MLEDSTLSVMKYDIQEAVIVAMEKEFLPLKIDGLDDKENFALVHSARMKVRDLRIQVQKQEQYYKDILNTKKKEIMEDAKNIYDRLEPIETHLKTEEDRIEAIKEAIRQKKIAEEKARVDKIEKAIEDINRLATDLIGLKSSDIERLLQEAEALQLDEKVFMEFLDSAKRTHENVIASLRMALDKQRGVEAEDARRKAEMERLEALRKEQEAKAAELRKQAEEQEAERKKLFDQRCQLRRGRLIEIGMTEAATCFEYADLKMVKKALYDLSDEEFESCFANLQTEIEGIKGEDEALPEPPEVKEEVPTEVSKDEMVTALAHDKVDLLDYIDAVNDILDPDLKTDKARVVWEEYYKAIQDTLEDLGKAVREL